MFKLCLSVFAILFLIIACQKKTMPVITKRETAPIKPAESVYPPNPSILPDTVVGKNIYISYCDKCHGLPTPEEFTFKRWDGILYSMIPRAKLSAEQSAHITAYIKANSAK